MPLIIPYKDSPLISILRVMVLQGFIIIKYFKKIKWYLIVLPVLILFITGSLGIHLMVHTSLKIMALILGFFIGPWNLSYFYCSKNSS